MGTESTNAVRIDHQFGLADFLESHALLKEENLSKFVFVFDFDRTLTNGFEFSALDVKVPVDKRIRGGEKTLEVLSSLKSRGAKFFIVTARNPSVIVLQQLQASLEGPQNELGDLFDYRGKPMVIEFGGNKIANQGCLYATGYQKEIAIGKIITDLVDTTETSKPELDVFFFDDAITNSYSVLTSWMTYLDSSTSEKIIENVNVTAVWWDPFFEETEFENDKASMVPVHSESSDFNYHEFNLKFAASFGMNEKEFNTRRQVYLDEEKKYDRKGPSSLKEAPPEAKKIENVDSKFGDLASLFGKRK